MSNESVRQRTRIAVGVGSVVLSIGGIILCAGRLDWGWGWLTIALFTAGQTATVLYLRHRNPDVIKYRSRIGENTKPWDRYWLTGFVILFLAILCIGALDSGRYRWSNMPGGWWFVGAALYGCFSAFIARVMAVNPHFEKTVRIQHDRGHKVIDTGPYRFVRHPGYVGIIPGIFLSMPFLLGSWWAMIPALLSVAWLVLRTALEDRTLRAELEGYKEYAQRVKYRLIPFVW